MKLYATPSHIPALQQGGILLAVMGMVQDNNTLETLAAFPSITLSRIEAHEDGYLLSPPDASAKEKKSAPVAVGTPPSGAVIFWSFETLHRKTLEKLASTLNGIYPHERFIAETGDSTALLTRVLELTLKDTQTYAKRATALNSALSQLRQEHELTRKALHNMQDILWNIHGNPPRQNSYTKLGRGRITLEALRKQDADGFTQRLIAPSKGLAGIDIYVVNACDAPGLIAARLTTAATGETLASWKIPYNQLTSGWLHLPLSTNLSLNYAGLELAVDFVSPYGEAPSIGLTDEIVVGCTPLHIGRKSAIRQSTRHA